MEDLTRGNRQESGGEARHSGSLEPSHRVSDLIESLINLFTGREPSNREADVPMACSKGIRMAFRTWEICTPSLWHAAPAEAATDLSRERI